MKALVKDSPQDNISPWPQGLRLEQREIPANLAPDDEVLIKVLAAGIFRAEFPLEKFDDAMALIGRGEGFKVILKP